MNFELFDDYDLSEFDDEDAESIQSILDDAFDFYSSQYDVIEAQYDELEEAMMEVQNIVNRY